MDVSRVLFFGAYDEGEGYPRVRSLRQGLESYGVEVFGLREDLLPTKEKRRKALRSPWQWPGHGLRLLRGSRRLRRRLRDVLREFDFDAVLVPYPGWFSVKTAREVFDGPVMLDLFLSLADTACRDRKLFREGGLAEKALLRLDRRACAMADRVLLDTPLHAARVAELTGLPRRSFEFVPIGDPDAPVEAPEPARLREGERLRAVYVGTGVPLHGVETVLEACERFDGVDLTFIGGTAEQRARAERMRNCVACHPWVPTAELEHVWRETDVVFGIFGTSEKADSVIPYKVVHGLAHARTVITAETEAVQTMLVAGRDCLTTPVADATALCRALEGLRDCPRLLEQTSVGGRRRYERTFSPRAIGERLLSVLASIRGVQWQAPSLEASPDPRPLATAASKDACS